MKCRYSYCKHNGEVDKNIAVKDGNSYYHEECLKEKKLKTEIENYYVENMPSTTMQLLRKVIKQLIHEKGLSAEYVLFTIRYIKNNNKPINQPFALINYCNDNRIYELYKKQKINEKYKEMKIKEDFDIKNEVKFTYKNITGITNII